MAKVFIIEDEAHGEFQWKYDTFEDAITELRKRMNIPWNQKPNICPCISRKTCSRNYEIIEYETNDKPRKEIKRTSILKISSKTVKRLYN